MQIRNVVVQTLGPTETFVGQVAERICCIGRRRLVAWQPFFFGLSSHETNVTVRQRYAIFAATVLSEAGEKTWPTMITERSLVSPYRVRVSFRK
jgi:hypothetical protein